MSICSWAPQATKMACRLGRRLSGIFKPAPRFGGVGSGRESSSGPLAMADVDQDGDLDLFAGGRVIPKKYPRSASSLFLRNDNGHFHVDQANTRRLREIGMVSGAVWSDLDKDGDSDLLLACEWGSLRLFENEKGKLIDNTSEYGLAEYTGWWNGVATGDFNEDGRMDVVASNWGRNTVHEAFRRKPLRLYHGDPDSDGVVELLEAHFDVERDAWVPYRNRLGAARAFPFIRKRFRSHRAYAKADIREILGDTLEAMATLKADTLETSLFLNQGDCFTRRALPPAAQFAPAFAVCVADFDADGHKDLFLSQNFFATPR